MKARDIYCSFCGKSQREVLHLVKGHNAVICNECIYLCVEVIESKPAYADIIGRLDIWIKAQRPSTPEARNG